MSLFFFFFFASQRFYEDYTEQGPDTSYHVIILNTAALFSHHHMNIPAMQIKRQKGMPPQFKDKRIHKDFRFILSSITV